MQKADVFVVRQPESGLTLDRFLAFRLGVSRKVAKRLLDERRIFVNRQRVWIAHHAVRTGDEVEVVAGGRHPPGRPGRLRILYEDAACLVVDKPAGLASVGPVSAEMLVRAADSLLVAVHRLDRDTSGCMLFARGESARAALQRQFDEHAIEKYYQAIVIGSFPDSLRRVEKPVGGKSAITEFRVLRRTAEASWIEARPVTGRTHQIRVHLKAAGFPLAGDRAYATRPIGNDLIRNLPRQMLHAWRLIWKDPATGARRRVEAPLPPDFCNALSALGLAMPNRTPPRLR